MTSLHIASRPVEESEFHRFFEECRYTAFRLETLQVYDVGYEQEAFHSFLSTGEVITTHSQQEWNRIVGGKRSFRRVHVVTEPLTDYLRFECVSAYRASVQAGEDVRVIPTEPGFWPEGIPRFDYWLFDSEVLVRMNYESDGTMLAPELICEPEEIVRANVIRDRALYMATTFPEYEQRFDADMRPL